jgi:hypothetical protein
VLVCDGKFVEIGKRPVSFRIGFGPLRKLAHIVEKRRERDARDLLFDFQRRSRSAPSRSTGQVTTGVR